MDETKAVKIGVLVGLFVATLIFGLIPLVCLVRRSSLTQNIVALCNNFAGGVFLATLLLHMLPEAVETLDDAFLEKGIQEDFPFAEFLVAVGFFLVFITELLAHRMYGSSPQSNVVVDPNDATQSTGDVDALHEGERKRLLYSSYSSTANASHDHSHDPNNDKQNDDPILPKSIIGSIVFLMALSLHSLFEGMAIGLQDTRSGVIQVFIGVILHKCVLVFSFSLSVLHKTKVRNIVLYVTLLALMSPIGIAVGMVIPENTPEAMMANGVLQSIACGTILFIIFFEILRDSSPEHADNKSLLMVVCMLVGFGLMTGLQFMDHD
ncbi:zinc transporter ZIP1-like [Diadema antillarum]|uniref:zinc transporter ZIP1-like n=1 Tax=Diadema antillarum TaxID=105358 RepID=UPI003A8410A4